MKLLAIAFTFLSFAVSANPLTGAGCESILAATELGLVSLLEQLPTVDETAKIDGPEVCEQFIRVARAWAKEQRKGDKSKYCCMMPFYYPHKRGEMCTECPFPQLFQDGTAGADVSARVIALIQRKEALERAP